MERGLIGFDSLKTSREGAGDDEPKISFSEKTDSGMRRMNLVLTFFWVDGVLSPLRGVQTGGRSFWRDDWVKLLERVLGT